MPLYQNALLPYILKPEIGPYSPDNHGPSAANLAGRAADGGDFRPIVIPPRSFGGRQSA